MVWVVTSLLGEACRHIPYIPQMHFWYTNNMAASEVTFENYVSDLHSWLQNCNRQHDDECQVIPIAERSPHQIPDWVIDTEDTCIVCGCDVPRYVALSYVWCRPPLIATHIWALHADLDEKAPALHAQAKYFPGLAEVAAKVSDHSEQNN